MTAAEHRSEAQALTAHAAVERAKYDESETSDQPTQNTFDVAAAGYDNLMYNPTAAHLVTADGEMRAAAAHLKAARRLEAFEDARCQRISPAERSACPLLASSVREVTETNEGVRLVLNAGVEASAAFGRLDCHLAYAISQGFVRPSCPLFVKGMSLSLKHEGTGVIVLSAEDPAVAAAIREQARRIFLSAPPVSRR